MKHISISNTSESDDAFADDSQNVEDILAAARALQNPRLPLIADIVNPNLEANIKKNYRRSVVKRAVKPIIYTSTPCPTTRSGSEAYNISSITTIQDDELPEDDVLVEDRLEKLKVVNRLEDRNKSTTPSCNSPGDDAINEEVKLITSSVRAKNLSSKSLVKHDSKSKKQLKELEHSPCRINQHAHSREVERSRRIDILTKDNTQTQGQNQNGIEGNLYNISSRSKCPPNDNRSKHSDAEYSEKYTKYSAHSNRRRKRNHNNSDEYYPKNRKRRRSRARSSSRSSDDVNNEKRCHVIYNEKRKLRDNNKISKRPWRSCRPSRARSRRITEYDSYTEEESSEEKRYYENRSRKRTVKDPECYSRSSSSFSTSPLIERRYPRRRVRDPSPDYKKRLRNRKIRVPEEVKCYVKKSLRNYRSESRGNKYPRRTKHSNSPRKYSSYSSELDEEDYDERRRFRDTGYQKHKDYGNYNEHPKLSSAKSKNKKDLLPRESPEIPNNPMNRFVANKRHQHLGKDDSIEHPINHDDLYNNKLTSGLSCLSNFSPSCVISTPQEIGRIRTLRRQISKSIARTPMAHIPENVRQIFQDFDYSESDLHTTLQPNNDKYLRRSDSSSKPISEYDKPLRLDRTVKYLWRRQKGVTGDKLVPQRTLLKVKDAETQSSFKNLRPKIILNRLVEETELKAGDSDRYSSHGDKNKTKVVQREVENKILKIKDAATQSSFENQRPERVSTKFVEESSLNELELIATALKESISDRYNKSKIVQSNVDVNKKIKDAETQSSLERQVSSRISNHSREKSVDKSFSREPVVIINELEEDFDHCSPILESKIVQSHDDDLGGSSSEKNIGEESTSSKLSRKKTHNKSMSKQKIEQNTMDRNLPDAASRVDKLSMSGCHEISEHVESRRPVIRNLLRSFMNATSNSTLEVQRSKANTSNEENCESDEGLELRLSEPEVPETNEPRENCERPIQENSESVELPPTQECTSIRQQNSGNPENKLRISKRTPKDNLVVVLQNLTVKKNMRISSNLKTPSTVEPPKKSVNIDAETSSRKSRDRRKNKVKETAKDHEDESAQLEPANENSNSHSETSSTKISKRNTNVNKTPQSTEDIELIQFEPLKDSSIINAETSSTNLEGKAKNSTRKTNSKENPQVEEIQTTQLESPDENFNMHPVTSTGKLKGKMKSSKRQTNLNKTPEPTEDIEFPPKDSSIIHAETKSRNLEGTTKNSTQKTNLNEDPQVEEIQSTQLAPPDENSNIISETSFGKLGGMTGSSKRKTKVNKTPQASQDIESIRLESPKENSNTHAETSSKNLKSKNSSRKINLNENRQVEETQLGHENFEVLPETSSKKVESKTKHSKRRVNVNETPQSAQDSELIQLDSPKENPETSSRILEGNNSSRKTNLNENPQVEELQSRQLEPPDENFNTLPETPLKKLEGTTGHSRRKTNVNETPQATGDIEMPQLESPKDSQVIHAETSSRNSSKRINSNENPQVEEIQSTPFELPEENFDIAPGTSSRKLKDNKKKNGGRRNKNETPQDQKILSTDTNSKIVDETTVKPRNAQKTKKQTNSKKNKKLESDNLCTEDTTEGVRRSGRDRKPPKVCYWKEEVTEIDCHMYGHLVERRHWKDEKVKKPVPKRVNRKKKSEKQESDSQEAVFKKPSAFELIETNKTSISSKNSKEDKEDASEMASKLPTRKNKSILGANSTEQNQTQKVVSQKPSTSDTDFSNSNGNDFGYVTRDTSEENDALLSVDGAQSEVSFHEKICKEIVKRRDNILTCSRDGIHSPRHIDLGKIFKSKEKFGYVVIHPNEWKTSRCNKYTMVYTVFEGECRAKIGHKRYDCLKGMFSIPKGVNYVIENKGVKPVILHYVMCENSSTALSGG